MPTAFQGVTTAAPPEGVITPEAVLLEFATANVGSRAAAIAVDVVIQSVLLVALLAVSAVFADSVAGAPGWIIVTLLTIVIAFITVGYPIFWETVLRGRTPGKALLGLRVITTEGAPIRFRHALIRGLVGLFEIFACYGTIALIVAFVSARNQRLGDMAAGTLVLRQRMAQNTPSPVTFTVPTAVEPYVASLDVSLLTASDYQAVRGFLIRRDRLSRLAREQLSAQMATQYRERAHTDPPPGMDAEQFLTCVAAAYQRRFRRP